jgi:hypothetical protein
MWLIVRIIAGYRQKDPKIEQKSPKTHLKTSDQNFINKSLITTKPRRNNTSRHTQSTPQTLLTNKSANMTNTDVSWPSRGAPLRGHLGDEKMIIVLNGDPKTIHSGDSKTLMNTAK